MIDAAIMRLLSVPIIQTPDAPSGLTITINEQAKEKRFIIHVLFYSGKKRSGF